MPSADPYGLHLSTTSEHAAECYREGVAHMLAGWPEAGPMLNAAIEADPDFALAYAARARLHAMWAQHDAARTRIAIASEKVAGTGSEREIRHVQVLALAIAGRSRQALADALVHTDRWPTDRLILSLPLGAFGLFAFSGMAGHDQARVDLCRRHAASFDTDDWWFLNQYGWALAENGDASHGRPMLERTFELRRENANTVHALTHAMFEGGADTTEIEALVSDWLPGYDRSGILYGHIAWHAALAALEREDAATALAIYEDKIRPPVSQGTPINIVSDAASLLWRLEAYDHSVPQRLWHEAADYARQAFPKPGHGFVDPHLALIEAATGNADALQQRITALDERVAQGSLAACAVVPAIGRAALAFATGDYPACARILEPVAAEVVRIGGSGAQRKVVEETLLVALMRGGETAKAIALLDHRLHHRPSPRDARWRAELAG